MCDLCMLRKFNLIRDVTLFYNVNCAVLQKEELSTLVEEELATNFNPTFHNYSINIQLTSATIIEMVFY